MTSLSLLIDFSLKSILVDIRTATQNCFFPFDGKFFSQPFTLRRRLSLMLMCVSSMKQKNGFCFHIQHFIGELSPFILRDINNQ